MIFGEIAREVLAKTGVTEPRQNYEADDVTRTNRFAGKASCYFIGKVKFVIGRRR